MIDHVNFFLRVGTIERIAANVVVSIYSFIRCTCQGQAKAIVLVGTARVHVLIWAGVYVLQRGIVLGRNRLHAAFV